MTDRCYDGISINEALDICNNLPIESGDAKRLIRFIEQVAEERRSYRDDMEIEE